MLFRLFSMFTTCLDLSGPSRNMKVLAGIACKITEIQKLPYYDNVPTTIIYWH